LFFRRRGRDVAGDRDVFNEKPSHEDRLAVAEEDKSGPRYYETAVLHTTLGDIVLKLFPRECPKTVENFCVHAKNNYYNGHIFHRVKNTFPDDGIFL
jgi:peptidylprolyl isomerase domain and WD repeat-containing protein 1